MSQNSTVMPTVGVISGLTLVNDINAALDTIVSLNSGASAPSPVTTGMLWYNTTTKYIQQYDGTNWNNLWYLDATNHLSSMDIGGGITSQTITAAATTDIGTLPQPFVTINGTTTITSLGSSAKVGSVHILVFNGILTFTHNATSNIIPGGTRTTAVGDIALAVYLGSSNWRILEYVPLTGAAVSSIAGNTGAFTLDEGIKNSTNVIKADPLYFRGYLSGLTLSAAGGTGTFGIAVGAAVDGAATPLGLMVLSSAFTKTTASWAVGSGNGGLDINAIAPSTWYHVFLIKRPDTGVVDVCFSVTASAPTTGGAIPAAYTMSRRIGSMKTDGSSQWIKFTQTDNVFIWSVSVADVNAIANTTSRVNKVLSTPTGIVTAALFRAGFNNAGAMTAIFTSLQESDQAPAITGGLGDIGVGASGSAYGMFERLTDTSSQIGVRSTAAGGTYSIFTYGWKDTRGQ